MIKNNWKTILSTLLLVFFTFVIVFYIKKHWQDFQVIKDFSWQILGVIALTELFCLYLQGLVLKLTIKEFGINLSLKEWFGLTVATTFGNYIFPFAGLGFRGVYLNKKHKFNYSHFISTVAAVYVIQFIISSMGGLIGLLSIEKEPNLGLILFFVVTLILGFVFILVPLRKSFLKYNMGFIAKILAVWQSWHKIRSNVNLVFKLLGLMAAQFTLTAVMFYLTYKLTNNSVSFAQSFLPTSLSSFSAIFRLTPASIGVYEGLIVYSTYVFNLTVSEGLIVAAVTRLATMFWGLTLGPIFLYLLIYRHKNR